jgi:hypothetical protein
LHLWECNDKKGELFDENNDNEMKKIRIRSLTCRQFVYSKRSIIFFLKLRGGSQQNAGRIAFPGGGSEPFIREVGWEEEHFRQFLEIFHKIIRFSILICP